MNEATKNLHWMLFATLLMFSITLASVGTASPDEITIAVEPSEVKDLEPDTTFTVDITVTDIVINNYTGLFGWDVTLEFNSKILNVVNATEGPFLKTVRNETTWEVGYQVPKIDNSAGTLRMGNTFIPPFPPEGATGSGTLATVTFKVVSRGTTSLHFEVTKLMTRLPPDITYKMPCTAVDGSFDNGAETALSIELIVGIIIAVTVCCAGAFFYMRRRRK